MKLSKGQAKLGRPTLKVPSPVREVYRELRGQRLLPLVVLLIASLMALPFLLSESADSQPSPEQGAAATSSSTATTLTATTWHPGLRKYQDRLSSRQPTDPFTNGGSAAASASSSDGGSGEAATPAAPELPAQPESAAGESAETPSTTTNEPASEGAQPQGPASDDVDSGGSAIDVEVTAFENGRARSGSVRYRQPQLTKLPNDSVTALTYVGPSDSGREAMMLVSSQVTALAGSSKCVVPGAPCQLLALQLKTPETIVVGPDGSTFRIELMKIGALSEPKTPRPSSNGRSSKAAIGQATVAPAP